MSDKAGVWIDHRKAVVVTLTADAERTATILSTVERHLERGGDSPLKGRFEARQVPADNSQQRSLTGKLNSYYDAVIAVLSKSDLLLIFGPGEAKHELHRRLDKMKREPHVEAIETAARMTDAQIVAQVRAHFGVSVRSR